MSHPMVYTLDASKFVVPFFVVMSNTFYFVDTATLTSVISTNQCRLKVVYAE